MQSVSSRIWTRIVVSNSYDDNHYATGTSYEYEYAVKVNHATNNYMERLYFHFNYLFFFLFLDKFKIDNILRKDQNGLRRNRFTTSQILTIRKILEGVRTKNLHATILFVDFTKAFDSIHREKMEEILLVYGMPKETVAAITILYRNTKVKVRFPDGDRLLRHRSGSTASRHTSTIPLYHLSRLRA